MSNRLDSDLTFTRNDLAIQRLARLALMLMNTREPIPTNALLEAIYVDSLEDATENELRAAKMAFTRDIAALAKCGISIKNVSTNNKNNEGLWTLDSGSDSDQATKLDLKDALVLQALCTPIAQDPTFPWHKELREALLRITRSFDAAPALVTWMHDPVDSPSASEVRRAFDLNQAVKVSYTNRQGTTKDHVLCPLGIFPQLGSTYLVAADLTADKSKDSKTIALIGQPIKTFLLSKIHAARLLDLHYRMPDDFELETYIAQIRHPYQIGTNKRFATFVVMQGFENVAAQEFDNEMEQWEHAGHTYLRIAYADEHILTLWARNAGCIPLSPDSLVAHWNQLLDTSRAAKE